MSPWPILTWSTVTTSTTFSWPSDPINTGHAYAATASCIKSMLSSTTTAVIQRNGRRELILKIIASYLIISNTNVGHNKWIRELYSQRVYERSALGQTSIVALVSAIKFHSNSYCQYRELAPLSFACKSANWYGGTPGDFMSSDTTRQRKYISADKVNLCLLARREVWAVYKIQEAPPFQARRESPSETYTYRARCVFFSTPNSTG